MEKSNGYYNTQDSIEAYNPANFNLGRKSDDRFYCDQKLLRCQQPDGTIKIIWTLKNVGGEEFFNNTEESKVEHLIESGLFESIDGLMWKLRMKPG